MAKKLYDVVATIREEGRDKPRYINCGAVFEGDKGMSMKLESLPTFGWNGWLSFYTPKPKAEVVQIQGGSGDVADDLPF